MCVYSGLPRQDVGTCYATKASVHGNTEQPFSLVLLCFSIASQNNELVLLRTKLGQQDRDPASLNNTNKQKAYVVELYKQGVARLVPASTDESDEVAPLV